MLVSGQFIFKLISIFSLLLVLNFPIYSQIDSTLKNDSVYSLEPKIAGGQIETVAIWYNLGVGGLVDMDLLVSESKNSN